MNNWSLLTVAVLMSCGGKLSDEQRQRFKEGMEEQKIVRITEPEIMNASLEKGQAIVESLEAKPFSAQRIDSVQRAEHVKVRYVVPGAGNALAVEQELIEAYIAAMTTGAPEANLQKIYSTDRKDQFDTLLYSKPAVSTLADGTEQLDGIWNVYIPKKAIVLSISKEK